MLPVLKKFISTYCESCPVTSECLSTASEDDLHHTIRGGRLPLGQSANGSGSPIRERLSERWQPKSVPKIIKPGRTIRERGACKKMLHGILSADDITFSGRVEVCRGCKYDTHRKNYGQEKLARVKKSQSEGRKVCNKGVHPWVVENLVVMKAGDRIAITCRECRNEGKRSRRAKIDA
jgi:hypothetical protein